MDFILFKTSHGQKNHEIVQEEYSGNQKTKYQVD